MVLGSPIPGSCESVTGNVNFIAGVLHSDDDFSKTFGLDKRPEVGIGCDVHKGNWPLSLAFDYLFSYSDSKLPQNPDGTTKNLDMHVYSTGMYVGAKKILDLFPYIKPYVAAGICTVSMYIDAPSDNEYDFGIGAWGGAGAYFRLSPHLNAGLEWKWSETKLNIFNHTYDAGGNHFSLIAGYHF